MFGLEGKERQKKKDKKSYVLIRVSLLILEARINFIFYSCQRGRTLEFPSGILLKCPGTPLDPCFLEDNQLYWFWVFFFQATFCQSPCSVFTLCWKNQNFSKLLVPTQGNFFYLGFWRKGKQAPRRGCCGPHPGSDSSEEKIYLDFIRFNLFRIRRKPRLHLLSWAVIWQKYRKWWFFGHRQGEHCWAL